jgi:hypothetical protein
MVCGPKAPPRPVGTGKFPTLKLSALANTAAAENASGHVDLHSVADAIELPIGKDNHVAAHTEEATVFDGDCIGLAIALRHDAVNGSKVSPIR